jgi:hypothetical protein
MENENVIERAKKFKVGEKTFVVNFPNVGQLIDIESMKQALTNGRYGAMAASGIFSAYIILDVVDAISFFKVCVPEFAQYYNIQNYTNMNNEKMKELTQIYRDEIKPWYDSILKSLSSITNEQGD